MKIPEFLYNWIERRGKIPMVIWWFWNDLHWCYELDGFLAVRYESFCGSDCRRRGKV